MIPPFVSVSEARALPEVVYADLGTNPDGIPAYDAFLAGHLPGATFVDLGRWLAGPPSEESGRHPLPDPSVFSAGLASAGIGAGDVVVAYDRVGGVYAARLVWMLRVLGHSAAVLDGGLSAWVASAGEVATGEPSRSAAAVPLAATPIPDELLADLDEVVAYAATGGGAGQLVLDAREGERFRGAPHPLDTVSGHIPGARSLPCRENVDAAGLLLPRAELLRRLRAVGADDPDVEVISSCGSGVTACHNLLLLEHLGLGRGRLFPGSWSQWTGTGQQVDPGTGPIDSGPVDSGPAAADTVR